MCNPAPKSNGTQLVRSLSDRDEQTNLVTETSGDGFRLGPSSFSDLARETRRVPDRFATSSNIPPDAVLMAARAGAVDAVGQLLDSYRNYLRLLAASQLHGRVSQRVSPSDVVQETMLAAHRDFDQFHGETSAQFTAWLRAILSHILLNSMDRHLNGKRDARRDVSLEGIARGVDTSSDAINAMLTTEDPSPSAEMVRGEDSRRIADLLCELPTHYRDVILLRNFQGLRFEAVAREMERTPLAARLLWLRAIRRLRQLYLQESQG